MDKHCVVLNDIHIDIMDYIAGELLDLTFRARGPSSSGKTRSPSTPTWPTKEFLPTW